MTQSSLLIVGGTHGIGTEIARHYAEQGWSVVAGRPRRFACQVGGCRAWVATRGVSLWTSPSRSRSRTRWPTSARSITSYLSAIARDTNTLTDYNIAAARYLVDHEAGRLHRRRQRAARPVG